MENIEHKVERFRQMTALIAIVVTIYYLYWRITDTLNPNALVFSWLLYGAEVYGMITTFLLYYMVWELKVRKSPPPLPGKTLDVLITTKNEPVQVLRITLQACNDLKYPHRTLMLDDGNRPEVKALCEQMNCIYLARSSYENAKAGNLNFGLQHSTAEFIAVFDADHAPLPDFIGNLIGYFRDEKVAFVQTPQEFYNIDSFQHHADRKKKYIWGEQYLFFSLIQPGKDRLNAAYFVGSCAILRRKALDDIGGFATASITEDMLTSIYIHAKGWSSVYHNECMAYGIAAETLLPFHIQRQRWGIGGWQIFFKANPLFIKGLSVPQRLGYTASLIYPLEGFQKIIFYITPPVALFTGVLPMKALDVDYLLHFIPYYLISIFAFNEMTRGYGGNIMLEQFSMGKYVTYIKTLGLFLLPRKARKFKVTPKGGYSFAPSRLVFPQMAVFVISVTAIVWALVELLFQMRSDSFAVAVNCFWSLFNSGLGLAIISYDYKKLFQRRESFRIPDSVPVFLDFDNPDKDRHRFAVADNMTGKGISILAIGVIPVGRSIGMEIMLPNTTLNVNGTIVQEKSTTSDNYIISRLGIRFTSITREQQDVLARYLHESAVKKFMREYSNRYRTYIEKRFMTRQYFHERAYRFLTYLPLIVYNEEGDSLFAVIKDISESGLLLVTRKYLQIGVQLKLSVVLGKETIQLSGTVTRNMISDTEDFGEYLSGVYFDEISGKKVARILKVADTIGSLVLE
ncbi:MAG: glycosyltransferase [Nitrospirota bacterium]